jgi:hypothetical protein
MRAGLMIGRPIYCELRCRKPKRRPARSTIAGARAASEIGAGAGVRDAKRVEPRDRSQDRCLAVVDVVGDADRGNSGAAQSLSTGEWIGVKPFRVEGLGGRRLI